MSNGRPRFRRISLTLGRKKKKSVDERYADIQRDSVADRNGERREARETLLLLRIPSRSTL